MITAEPGLDATEGALPHKQAWQGIFHKKVLNFTFLAHTASRVLLPQPFLQQLELNFTLQVHD